jgi:hypothetical protein
MVKSGLSSQSNSMTPPSLPLSPSEASMTLVGWMNGKGKSETVCRQILVLLEISEKKVEQIMSEN